MGGLLMRPVSPLVADRHLFYPYRSGAVHQSLGISFVSKVAPPNTGNHAGAWLGATAVGNSLLFIGAIFYKSISMSATWMVFVVACLISMFTMLAMIKWLEGLLNKAQLFN